MRPPLHGEIEGFEAEPGHDGAAAGGHQDPVAGDGVAPAGGRFHRDHGRALPLLDAGHPCLHAEGDPLLLQGAHQSVGHLAVGGGERLGQHLHHGHLAAEPAPDRPQLQPDVAGPHHQQMLRHPVEGQGFPGGDHGLPVKGEARYRHRLAAGGKEHLAGLQQVRGRRPVAAHLHPQEIAVSARQASRPLQPGYPVLLEEVGDAVGELFHHIVLAGHHPRQVEPRRVNQDAVAGKAVPGLGKELR